MKPVMQTRVGVDPNAPGNCFTACVASILECSIADLPDEAAIVEELKAEHGGKWDTFPDRFKLGKSWPRLWDATQRECVRRGLWMLEVSAPLPDLQKMPDDCWCIISAPSPRGINHACVGRGERVVHDPHPSGGGVKEEGRTYIFFVAIDPTKHQ